MPVNESPVVLAGGTKITWAHYTFNPWWGCTVVSPACDNCYAERFAHRLGMDLWERDGDRRFFGEHHWNDPVRWNRKAEKQGVRYRVFCASMADVFEGGRDDLETPRRRLWRLIEETPHLDWLLLTKRPENILRMVSPEWSGLHGVPVRWPANAWIGTTVENQRYAELRLPKLVLVPAPVRFISYEPALGPVDLALWIDRVQWVIAGGESGPGARPSHPRWFGDVQQQCASAEVAFHFKQWGEWAPLTATEPPCVMGDRYQLLPSDNGRAVYVERVGKKAAGRLLDGRTWDEIPGPVR